MIEEITSQGGKTTSRYYVRGLDLPGTMDGAGGIGGLLATVDPETSSVYYHLYGPNGNTAQLLSDNGRIAAHYEYDLFGNIQFQYGPFADENPFRFSTKYFDEETGLTDFGSRYYDPYLARWTSRDPVGEAGGLNLYGFVGNDPVNRIDPFGQFALSGPGFSGIKPNHFYEPIEHLEYYGTFFDPKSGVPTDMPGLGSPFFDEGAIIDAATIVASGFAGLFIKKIGEKIVFRIGKELAEDGLTECQEKLIKEALEDVAQNRGVANAEKIAGSKISHINGAIGEAHGWQHAIDDLDHIGVKPPGKVTARGVDYVTYDPRSRTVFLWDSKYRGAGGSYPSSVPSSKLPEWTNEARTAVESMQDSPLKTEILDALNNGRVDPQIFRWPQ